MGRVPCCEKDNVKRGQWTPEEDNKLSSYISQHGTRNWRLIPKNAGLQRCGKSCRLRWTNYLRPDLKHGQFTDNEEQTIVKLHSVVGNRWSLIAAQLPGRTDNDVKNYWNTKLKKKLSGMGIDPVTHKPFSHLMAEIATTLAPPQVAHLAEAALGCFKDEMLHLLTKKRIDFQVQPQLGNANANGSISSSSYQNGKEISTVDKIRLGLSRAIIREPDQVMIPNKPWDAIMPAQLSQFDGGLGGNSFLGYDFGQSSCANNNINNNGSPWNQSMCSGGSTSTMGNQMGHLKLEENGEEATHEGVKDDGNGSSLFVGSECVLWDLPSDDLINPLV